MKNFLLTTCLFMSLAVIADDHETSEKSPADRFTNNPNYLLSFKECKETKEGCLLYTSPSPRDGLLSRMPSSA